jgi:hypothetical protein
VNGSRQKNRVVKVESRVEYRTKKAVMAALEALRVSDKVNTAFVERDDGTDRNRNGREVRKTYGFS